MKTKLLSLSLFLLLAFTGFSQNYTFTPVTPCPQPLYSSASFTIGDSIFVIGGVIANAAQQVKTLTTNVWLYNTRTDTWTQKNPFPGTAVYGASGFSINNYGYVVNGWDSSGTSSGPNQLWRYDPTIDAWTTRASFPGSTRYTCGVFTLNNKAYIACGFKPYVNDMYCYDPATNTWSQKASIPGQARQCPETFTLNGYGYLGMGATIGYPIGYTTSDWFKYDPNADTWTTLNLFPGDPTLSSYVFVLNNEAYLVNGLTRSNLTYNIGAANKVWKYTPGNDSWNVWGIFPDTAIYEGEYATVGNNGYMGLGAQNWFTYPLTPKFWRFGPGNAPYSCNATITTVGLNNATQNFQATGNFSPTATVSWDFGDSTTGSGTSVFHTFSPGNYQVSLTVTDSTDSCTYTTSTNISILGVSNCSVSVAYTNFSTNYTLYANTTGVSPYTYNWTVNGSPIFNGTSPDPLVSLTPGQTYTACVVINDSTGCVDSACTSIYAAPDTNSYCQTYLYIYPDGNVPGLYYAYVFHFGAAPVSYLWDFGDGTTSTQMAPVHVYSTMGFYDVCLTITDSAGCTSSYCDSFFYSYKMAGGPMNMLQATQSLPAGIASTAKDLPIAIYPNPVSKELNIAAAGSVIQEITIYTAEGQKVKQLRNTPTNKVDVSALAPGAYFINIKTNNGQVQKSFVKTNE